jgi:REP element-mobilizing transposase RayT
MADKPKYNPNIHHRRSIRLKGYDYAQAGLYFITICCDDRKYRFGKIENGEVVLNELGIIAYNEWLKLSERFTNFELDVFQIMPNHIHGIIALVGATLAVAQNDGIAQNDAVAQNDDIAQNDAVAQNDNDISDNKIGQLQKVQPQGIAPTVGNIVGAYKSLVANGCLEIYKSKNEMMGKLWHRNYHEHIIRNEQSYQTISNYIINNPAKWEEDKFYNK